MQTCFDLWLSCLCSFSCWGKWIGPCCCDELLNSSAQKKLWIWFCIEHARKVKINNYSICIENNKDVGSLIWTATTSNLTVTRLMLFSKLLHDCHTIIMIWQWKPTFESQLWYLLSHHHHYCMVVCENLLNIISLITTENVTLKLYNH